jgi:hypothetical protein
MADPLHLEKSPILRGKIIQCDFNNKGDVYVKSTGIKKIETNGNIHSVIDLKGSTRYVIYKKIYANKGIIMNNCFVPSIFYNITTDANIVTSDECEIYIDSLSLNKFKGKFIGPFKSIKIYPYDNINNINFDLIFQDETLPDIIKIAKNL